MREEKSLYFTPAEFAVMVELSGKGECTLLRAGEDLDDEALTLAFISLFQRGLLQRSKGRFVPAGEGELFSHIWNAPTAVVIAGRQDARSDAICYVEGDALWMVELTDAIVARQYRVQALERSELAQWLFDAGLLSRPMFTDGDVPELMDLFAGELEEGSGHLLLRMEKYANGGGLLASCELRRGESGDLLCGGEAGERVEPYTQEALSRMLADCFGKETSESV